MELIVIAIFLIGIILAGTTGLSSGQPPSFYSAGKDYDPGPIQIIFWWVVGCAILMWCESNHVFGQELTVTSTAIAHADHDHGDGLITVSHDTVEPGNLFVVKIKAGVPYEIDPKPRSVTTFTDDKTGKKVLLITAGKEPITVSVETSEVRIGKDDVSTAPLFSSQESLDKWLESHSVPVHESRTVQIDKGLTEFSKDVRRLAREIEDKSEVEAIIGNYEVITAAIDAGVYDSVFPDKPRKRAGEDVFALNRGKVDSDEWNTFFKKLANLEYEREKTLRELFVEIRQGLEASLD